MADRSYSKTTEAVLFATSIKCYYPDCQVPSVSIFSDNTQKKNVQIAHIVAVSPNGPRYRPLPKEQRDSFDNLILLCHAHHPVVDKKKNENEYPEELLCGWKRENEGDLRAKIERLEGLTKDDLEEMLTIAGESAKKEILSAIDRLKETSEDAATLLRALFDKIESYYLDQESIAMLHAASQRLVFLEEGATLLWSASQRLGSLEEGSQNLLRATVKLQELDSISGNLVRAASELSELNLMNASLQLGQFAEDYASMIRRTPKIPDVSGLIESAGEELINEIDQKISTINSYQLAPVLDHPQRWKFGFGGFALGVFAVLATVVILASTGAI